MHKWDCLDYFNSKLPSRRDLNDYGEDGWELIAIVEDESETAGKGYRLYLKRPASS